MRPLYEHVLQQLEPLANLRLLDVGCGAGLFAEMATRAGADVIGLDAAAGLIEYARHTRPVAGFIIDDLEHTPFDDGVFDLVTAFNSVLYAADPRHALAELARVTAESGRAVVTVGVGPDQLESASLIRSLARAEDLPSNDSFDLADRESARRALLAGGFETVTVADVSFDVDYQNDDEAVAAHLPAGPVAAAVRHSGRPAVETALRAFFAPRTRNDQTVRMGVEFRCYTAHRRTVP